MKVTIYGHGGGYYRDFDAGLINVQPYNDKHKRFTHTAHVRLPDFNFPTQVYKTSLGWMNWFGVEFL